MTYLATAIMAGITKLCQEIMLDLFFLRGSLPVGLYLNFEKSSWKIQVRPTGLFGLQKIILKLIFTDYTGSKNQVRNRHKYDWT